MPEQDWISHSPEETTAWGREIGARLKPPVLVLLTGEVGAGKTTLTKGLIAGLGAAREEEVTSPTFTLVHVFANSSPTDSERAANCKVYHVDLYRVTDFRDFETLGLEDAFAEPAIVIVEWAEKFALRTDWPIVRIQLEHHGPDTRRVVVHDPAGVLQKRKQSAQ